MPTLPTPRPDILWPEWLLAFGKLKRIFSETIAAPFWSAADEQYGECRQRFLMVGQATAGPYGAAEFSVCLWKSSDAALSERKILNRSFVTDHPKRSAFWRSFVQGTRFCGSKGLYTNGAWTNLAKVGFANKNVNPKLFQAQEELAEQTLQAELADYNPTIVHFATGTLGGQCILRATVPWREIGSLSLQMAQITAFGS